MDFNDFFKDRTKIPTLETAQELKKLSDLLNEQDKGDHPIDELALKRHQNNLKKFFEAYARDTKTP
jgi:hypothetical protein